MANVLEERSSTSPTEISLYQLYSMRGDTYSLNIFLSRVLPPLRHYIQYAAYYFLMPVSCNTNDIALGLFELRRGWSCASLRALLGY